MSLRRKVITDNNEVRTKVEESMLNLSVPSCRGSVDSGGNHSILTH
jgi:hypothetical protein